MTKKPPKNKSGKLANENGYITAKELMAALDSFKASILLNRNNRQYLLQLKMLPDLEFFIKRRKVKERN